MRSITQKLIAAFLGIGLISILVVVLVARWNTSQEFNKFVSGRNQEELATRLTDYYRTNGSWNGVAEAFGQIESATDGTPAVRFILADVKGVILVGGPPRLKPGDQASQQELASALPLKVDNGIEGYLIVGRIPPEGRPLEASFIRQMNIILIYSGLAAIALALAVGAFLSRTLTRPIRELTAATHAVAQGQLGLQVAIRSRDELGELTRSFNKMSADLANSRNARRQMTADIAHELRTPLSLILGHAEAVHDGVLPPTSENFEVIREAAGRLDHLVEDLRTLSLADAGELSLHPEAVKPQKLLQEVAALYRYQVQKKNISLELDSTPSLANLKVDPGRMTQVLTNILDNAIRHTPEGGRITLAARQVQGGVQISVQDSGTGVSSEDVERIFERFYRMDDARSREQGGSGLGLAIAKSIVQAHGGKIWAESVPGQGLTIFVFLPVSLNH
jgi:two-component system sensor histidine kinase BaeS